MRPLFFLILFIGLTVKSPVGVASDSHFKLNSRCPASFELKHGKCFLVSQYQFYDSTQHRGVGGTQTSLPTINDGYSPQQIDLGRYLFFDPVLSKDGSLSCASCHQPDKGFSDDLDRSVGITGQKVGRSSPSLWNVGFLGKLFWDARATTLEEQASGPLFDENEMGNTPQNLLATLNENTKYSEMFASAYQSDEAITLAQVVGALSAFQASLISLNSRYDRYAHGYHQALNEQEIAGLNVFRSFVARCSECHQPPLFTNDQIAVIGTPEPTGMSFDVGAQKTFNEPKLRGGFKVPTLRNIIKTAPYMHSGKFDNLFDAIEFYTKGRGHAVPKDQQQFLHWHIWEPDLSDQEIESIIDFLATLSDESLMPVIPKIVPSGLSPIDATYQNNNKDQ